MPFMISSRVNSIDCPEAIPIVLMTARAQRHEIQEYMSGGATAVITKPFDPMTLGDQVIKIWEDNHAPA